MRKTIIKLQNEKLGIEFSDREVNEIGIVCGDVLYLDDMLTQKIPKTKTRKK